MFLKNNNNIFLKVSGEGKIRNKMLSSDPKKGLESIFCSRRNKHNSATFLFCSACVSILPQNTNSYHILDQSRKALYFLPQMSDPKYAYPYPAQGQGKPLDQTNHLTSFLVTSKYHFFFSPDLVVFFLYSSILFYLLLLLAGYYQGPPVMAPPQYYAAPPPRRQTGFLEGWLVPFITSILSLSFFFLVFSLS